jgi:hypothetical protein
MQTITRNSHPIIICFGDTATANYPLILIVGREPNSDHPVCNEVGTYDFRKAPQCGFWNASYALAARQVNLTSAQLKRRCIELNGSPLLYADAMPQGLLNAVPNKGRRRRGFTDKELQDHVSRIFEKPIIKRVKLVILSGLEHRVFEPSRQRFEELCGERSIQRANLPFFSNQNAPRINQQLDAESQRQIAVVVSEFLTYEIR